MEVIRQHNVIIKLHQMVIQLLRSKNKPANRDTNQKIAKMIYVRLKVTISLYLSPNNMEKSIHAYGRQRQQ